MVKNFTCLCILIIGLIGSSGSLAQAPANDECTGAIAISLTPFGATCSASVHASTAGATQSSPNPNCTPSEHNDDIWYSFTATTASVLLRFSNVINDGTGGEGYVGFALYSGCPASVSPIICNNIVSAGAGFLIINGLTTGTTYYLRFWSTLFGLNSASFDFCVQEVPAPVNDECATATVITSEPVATNCNATHHATTVGASPSAFGGSCATGFDDDDIWYTFTAHTSGIRLNFSNARTATSTSGNANVGYALYDMACPAGTAAFSCDDNIGSNSGSTLISGLVPGHQYYLRLFSFATNRYMTLDFCLVDVDLPLNDECSNAIALTTGSGFCTNLATGDLSNATTSVGFGTPACAAGSSSEDVWFRATVPATGNILIQTSAVNTQTNDLVMEAYSGTCGALTFITCSDDDNPDPEPSARHARISLTGRTPGEIIFLRVLGKHVINWGPFAICAWDSTVLRPVSPGVNCIAGNTVTINTAHNNRFMWVPVFDAAGNIMAEVFGNGSDLNNVQTALYVNGSGTVRNISGQFYLDRNMSVTTSGPGGARVRFYFTNSEFSALQQVQLAASLAMLKINKTSTACQAAFSGAATIINQDATKQYGNDHYLEFSTPSFSSFYIDATTVALPLRFVSFTAEKNGTRASLQWVVLQDADIKNFEVQKMNAAGQYSTIAQKEQSQIAATFNGAWQYTFTDNAPASGNNFYRIKMNTYSGTALYSPIAILKGDQDTNMITVFPNPVQDYLTIKAGTNIKFIHVIDAAGKVLKQYYHPVRQNGIILLDLQSFPTGLYIVQIGQERGLMQQMKIVKH
jgi:hypothetical protein